MWFRWLSKTVLPLWINRGAATETPSMKMVRQPEAMAQWWRGIDESGILIFLKFYCSYHLSAIQKFILSRMRKMLLKHFQIPSPVCTVCLSRIIFSLGSDLKKDTNIFSTFSPWSRFHSVKVLILLTVQFSLWFFKIMWLVLQGKTDWETFCIQHSYLLQKVK